MGQLATSAGKLQKAAPANDFKSILAAQWPKIQAVMPRHMSADRLFQLAVSAYNQTPKLAECSVQSVLSCVMKCGALGLEPSAVDGLGRAYILPFRNGKTRAYEATFILGYKGMIDLARRSGEIKSISARSVYEGDVFAYSYGLHEDLTHTPSTEPKAGRQLTHAYCIAEFADGGHYFNVLTREDIEAARKASKAGNAGPWATHYEQMAIKTAVRRAFPYLPVSIEAQQAAAVDETTPDYTGILAPVVADSAPVEVDPVAVEPVEPETPAGAPTEPPVPIRRAVCRSCGYVLEGAPADPATIKFECCENPAFEIVEG